jgi:hypothetical protein
MLAAGEESIGETGDDAGDPLDRRAGVGGGEEDAAPADFEGPSK